MSVRTDNAALNEVLERALSDVRMLCNRYDTGIYPTGGLPWYAVPFGRDPLITSILLLHVNPELAAGVLRYLAAKQGSGRNDRTARSSRARSCTRYAPARSWNAACGQTSCTGPSTPRPSSCAL